MVALLVVGGWVHREGLEEARNLASSMLAVVRVVQVAGCRKPEHLVAQHLSGIGLSAWPL